MSLRRIPPHIPLLGCVNFAPGLRSSSGMFTGKTPYVLDQNDKLMALGDSPRKGAIMCTHFVSNLLTDVKSETENTQKQVHKRPHCRYTE